MTTDEEIAVRLAVALIEKRNAISAIEAAGLYNDCLEALDTIRKKRRPAHKPRRPQAETEPS